MKPPSVILTHSYWEGSCNTSTLFQLGVRFGPSTGPIYCTYCADKTCSVDMYKAHIEAGSWGNKCEAVWGGPMCEGQVLGSISVTQRTDVSSVGGLCWKWHWAQKDLMTKKRNDTVPFNLSPLNTQRCFKNKTKYLLGSKCSNPGWFYLAVHMRVESILTELLCFNVSI